jgi:hypothetical protein
MKEDEAKHLVDQFNKYASWAVRGYESIFSFSSFCVAGMAVLIAVAGSSGIFSNFLSDLPGQWKGLAATGMIAAIAVPMFLLARKALNAFDALIGLHEENRAKLIALENHRSRHGSLPDGLTFEKIVCMKPDELAEALERPPSGPA